jgi:hypothetical protein
VCRSVLMSVIMTFMFEPAKLQMNWAKASGTSIARRDGLGVFDLVVSVMRSRLPRGRPLPRALIRWLVASTGARVSDAGAGRERVLVSRDQAAEEPYDAAAASTSSSFWSALSCFSSILRAAVLSTSVAHGREPPRSSYALELVFAAVVRLAPDLETRSLTIRETKISPTPAGRRVIGEAQGPAADGTWLTTL